ncbi:hypothetical protein A4A49_62796, partial [Nicotiana attenuata]
TKTTITWNQAKKKEIQQNAAKYQIQFFWEEEMMVIQFAVTSSSKDKSWKWALLLFYCVMETLLVVLMLSIQSNGLKLHIGCSISTYISTTQVIASKGNKQCNVINALGMRTTKFLSILKEYCWIKQKCNQTFTHQQEYIIQDSGYQSLIRKAYPQAKQKLKKENYIYQKGKEKNVTLKTFYKIFSHMQGILSSNNDNLSNIAALLNGKSACTTIRFERRRLLSNAFTLSAGRALTRGDRADSHGKWSILWEATATGYGLVAMEKMSGRREDSRARFCGKRERVEREGRYGREKVSENEMKVRIGIGDIWGVCIQMWPLMQCVNFERAGHEIGYNRNGKVVGNVGSQSKQNMEGTNTGKEIVPVENDNTVGTQQMQTKNKFEVLEVENSEDNTNKQLA